MSNASAGHPDNHPADIGTRCSLAITKLASFVDDLIKSRKDVICKLDLNNRPHPFSGGPNCGTNDSLLCQRCVEDSICAEFSLQAACTAENSAKRDVFSEAEHLA